MHRMVDRLAVEQAGSRTPIFVFGDVHGCARELVSLLDKAADCITSGPEQTHTEHAIVLGSGQRHTLNMPSNVVWLSLGDAFSKGPDPWGVYEIFRTIGVVMVRGNHEHRLLRWWYRKCAGVYDGNRRSQQMVDRIGVDRVQRIIRWIEQSPYIVTGGPLTWMLGKERWMAVHAGPDMRSQGLPDFLGTAKLSSINESLRASWLDLSLSGDQQQLSDAVSTVTELRYLDPHDRLHWSRVHKSPTLVIYGHNPCSDPRFGEIKLTKRRVVHSIGIDTGCVYGGRLSGFWLDNGPDRLLSVKAQRQYCEVPRKSQMR